MADETSGRSAATAGDDVIGVLLDDGVNSRLDGVVVIDVAAGTTVVTDGLESEASILALDFLGSEVAKLTSFSLPLSVFDGDEQTSPADSLRDVWMTLGLGDEVLARPLMGKGRF